MAQLRQKPCEAFTSTRANHLAKVWTRNPKNEFAFTLPATPSLQSKSERKLNDCLLIIMYPKYYIRIDYPCIHVYCL